MKTNTFFRRAAALLLGIFIWPSVASAAPTTVFATGFEVAEAYNPQFEIWGQNDWTGFGSAGNGLLERFPGPGQQGYIGIFGPTNTSDTSHSIWRPIGFDPLTNGKPIVTFTVDFEIVDSTSPSGRDDFRWAIYNTAARRLFSVDFDNSTTGICYLLEGDTQFRQTSFTFSRNTIYTLGIRMDFSANRWSAMLDSTTVITNQPITTAGSRLDLGDIDAVWAFLNGSAGDNFMAFDNYRITAEADIPLPPSLNLAGMIANGQPLLNLVGENDRTYVIEATSDFVNWTPIKTNSPTDGQFQFLDIAGTNSNRRFYRVKAFP